MMKLIVAFRNFANTPTKRAIKLQKLTIAFMCKNVALNTELRRVRAHWETGFKKLQLYHFLNAPGK